MANERTSAGPIVRRFEFRIHLIEHEPSDVMATKRCDFLNSMLELTTRAHLDQKSS